MKFFSGDQVSVLLPIPLGKSYDYIIPDTIKELTIGEFVDVPFGHRTMIGAIWGKAAAPSSFDKKKIKTINQKLEIPPLSETNRKFVDWVAGYTMSPLGAVLKMVLCAPSALEPPKLSTLYSLPDQDQKSNTKRPKLTKQRKAVIDLNPMRMTAKQIADKAGVGVSVITSMAKAGLLEKTLIEERANFKQPDISKSELLNLSTEQEQAANALNATIDNGFSSTLLYGVTGSGKTEVYLSTVAEALKHGKQVLVMLPEIALTSQWLEKFKRRFGVSPAEWHSDIGEKSRRQTWRAVLNGEVKVIVGARSALFLPYKDLGLIIIDEEHDHAFKQEENVIYHGRDMAVVRAKISDIPILLASATPALETINNVIEGRYKRVDLKNRFSGVSMPEISIINMKKDMKDVNNDRWISPTLEKAITLRLQNKEQSLLFLNRRGYAPLTLCRACGHRMQCPNCTSWLVEHKHRKRLICHHCDYSTNIKKACPECGAEGEMAACGPGVERINEEVNKLFPDANIAMMTSDTVTNHEEASKVIRKIIDHEIDILIGTQMLAKGHHFPSLTLVGAVDADTGLSGGDLRAAEKTFQILSQVAGRAGREEKLGEVLLQTYEPESMIMEALQTGDKNKFIKIETEGRKILKMPPFGKLAAIIISGKDQTKTYQVAKDLGKVAPHTVKGITVLGPAEAPIHKLRNNYRYRMLLKADRNIKTQHIINQWLSKIKVPSSVKIKIDIDPYSFL
ncbi:MAG: primosomal protein N' [Alphaproteobacteria bacterium]|nr:primosomal protein N' [Alphaproteobacteria bacterium]